MSRQPHPYSLLPPPRPRWLERATDAIDALLALLMVGGIFAIIVLICFIAVLWIAPTARASGASHPHTGRSVAALHSFKKAHPCPSPEYVASRPMRCPGFVVDHVEPIACGGADAPGNMQWQLKAQARAKDTWERVGCAYGHRYVGVPITRDAARLAQQ